MKEIRFDEISDEVIFSNIYGMFQRWEYKRIFSYLQNPRPNHGLMYVLCDHITVTESGGETCCYKRGAMLYIPEGFRYSICFDSKQTVEINTLLINFSMHTPEGEPLCFGNRIYPVVSEAPHRYTEEFYKIISAFQNTQDSYPSIKASFYSLLDKIMLHLKKRSLMNNEYAKIAPAILYMDGHIDEELSVPEFARLCAMSETCFRRYFKSCTGLSPARYMRRIKIQKAKEMLCLAESTLSNVAYELGFYDLSYFCKCFRAETGMTPQEYKNGQESAK